MRHIDRRHPVVRGIALGFGCSLVGGTIVLDVLGFWMGGLIMLPVTGLLGLTYASWRQRAPTTLLWWAAGVVMGLLPVSAFLAARTSDFWFEFLLPLVTGLLLALTVGPLYVLWIRRRPHGPATDVQAT